VSWIGELTENRANVPGGPTVRTSTRQPDSFVAVNTRNEVNGSSVIERATVVRAVAAGGINAIDDGAITSVGDGSIIGDEAIIDDVST